MFLCRVSLGRQLRKVLPSAGLRRVPDPFPLFPSQLSPWLFGCASRPCQALVRALSTTLALVLLLRGQMLTVHRNRSTIGHWQCDWVSPQALSAAVVAACREKAHSIFAPAKTPPSMLLMNEFIVFHSNQGYPEYLIDFTLK